MTALVDRLTTVYTASHVCHAARITYRQLDYAVRMGLVQSSRHGDGSGHTHRFRPVDIHVATVMGRLSDLGAQHPVRRAVARKLYDLPRPWVRCWLAVMPTDPPSVFVLPVDHPLRDLWDAQLVLRLPPTLEPLP